MEQQIAKEEALTAKHLSESNVNTAREYKEGAQGELNQAKAITENAKVRNLHSDSDSKDLHFVEQESGVHQARDLEKFQILMTYHHTEQQKKYTHWFIALTIFIIILTFIMKYYYILRFLPVVKLGFVLQGKTKRHYLFLSFPHVFSGNLG